MLKLSKKIALPLIAVLLIGTGVGGYFLFRNFQLPRYFVDRYPELLEYCDTEESEGGLKISCKALMLDIKPNVSDGTPSLTSLVITNNEELKEYTITEKEAKFAFTNDILQFKKLKPVIINIQYTKINPIKYAVQSITFEDIPETYIQEIVNRDIDEIMGMDRSSTTILNSFDFCPRPETLPDYVVKKDEYAKYWNENILSKQQYNDFTLYQLDDPIIRIMFACDQQNKTNNLTICTSEKNNSGINSPKSLGNFSLRKDINDTDKLLIKEISTFYDNFFLGKVFIDINQKEVLKNISAEITDTPINSIFLCTYYKTLIEINPILFNVQILQIENYIVDNITNIGEPFCLINLNDRIDKTGSYLFGFLTNYTKDFQLIERCLNSSFILK